MYPLLLGIVVGVTICSAGWGPYNNAVLTFPSKNLMVPLNVRGLYFVAFCQRISFLSHFSTANKTVGEVYAGDVVAAIESADELHISILILLLRALPRHELPKNANVGYAVSVLQR